MEHNFILLLVFKICFYLHKPLLAFFKEEMELGVVFTGYRVLSYPFDFLQQLWWW